MGSSKKNKKKNKCKSGMKMPPVAGYQESIFYHPDGGTFGEHADDNMEKYKQQIITETVEKKKKLVDEIFSDPRNKRYLDKGEVRGRLAAHLAGALHLVCSANAIYMAPEDAFDKWVAGEIPFSKYTSRNNLEERNMFSWCQDFLSDMVVTHAKGKPFDYDEAILNAKWVVPITGRLTEDMERNYVALAFSKVPIENLRAFMKDYFVFFNRAEFEAVTFGGTNIMSLLPSRNIIRKLKTKDDWHQLITHLANEYQTYDNNRTDDTRCSFDELLANEEWKRLIFDDGPQGVGPLSHDKDGFYDMVAPGFGIVDNRMEGTKKDPLNSGIAIDIIAPPSVRYEAMQKFKNHITGATGKLGKATPHNVMAAQKPSVASIQGFMSEPAFRQQFDRELDAQMIPQASICRNPTQEEEEAVKRGFEWLSILNEERKLYHVIKSLMDDNKTMHEIIEDGSAENDKLIEDAQKAKAEADRLRAELDAERRKNAAMAERTKKLEKRVDEAVAKSESRNYEIETLQRQVEALQDMLAAPVSREEETSSNAALDTSIFEDHKIVCVGGYPTWAESMRSLHPNLRVYETDGPVPDDYVLDSADIIWIQAMYIPHKLSKPVCDRARANNIPLRFFSTTGQRRCKEDLIRISEEVLLGGDKQQLA